MEARMTICNMSIEMGARCGMIAPDETTFSYMKGRKLLPRGQTGINHWLIGKRCSLIPELNSIRNNIDAAEIEPMITYGTNPGMGIGISGHVPNLRDVEEKEKPSFEKSLKYMGLEPGMGIKGKKVDYVFIGSCTNSRIEDLRLVASFVKGKQKAKDVQVWIVPGSKQVEKQAQRRRH